LKKEIVALAALALLLIGAFVNIHFLNRLTGEIIAYIEEADWYIREENWDKAREKAEKANARWEGSESYTHIVLRHSDIDSAGNTLTELLKEIKEENAGAAEAAAKAAAARFRSVATIERVRLGSVF